MSWNSQMAIKYWWETSAWPQRAVGIQRRRKGLSLFSFSGEQILDMKSTHPGITSQQFRPQLEFHATMFRSPRARERQMAVGSIKISLALKRNDLMILRIFFLDNNAISQKCWDHSRSLFVRKFPMKTLSSINTNIL